MNFLKKFFRPVESFDPEEDLVVQRALDEMDAGRKEKSLLRGTLDRTTPDPLGRQRTGFPLGDAAVGRRDRRRDRE